MMAELIPEHNKEEADSRRGIPHTFLTGFFIGIGAIAPGISGGAIAVIFGLYDRITDAIAHFYRNFLEKMKFLLPLFAGAGLGVFLFGKVIFYLFEHYNVQVRFLFIGLMMGTLPSVFHTANKKGVHWWYLLPMAGGAALILMLTHMEAFVYSGTSADISFPLLLVSGAILGFGTIVPGVSSSFILMSMGMYDTVMEAIAHIRYTRLVPIAIGFIAFVLLFAKLIDWMYRKAYGLISYIVCGLLLGSIVPVIPPMKLDVTTLLAGLLAVTGGLLSWYLLHINTRHTPSATATSNEKLPHR